MSDALDTLALDPADLTPQALHAYLLAGIAPRPIAFASTVDAEGNPNLAPFSYFNVFSANPPILIFSPARRGKDNTTKHTLANVQAVPEVVINLVDHAMVQQCSLASGDFPEGVSEFEMAGLTPLASSLVKPFRVAESPVQVECQVERVEALGTGPGAGHLVVCRIVQMHFRRDVLTAEGKPDIHRLDLVGRCGGEFYVRASGEALFEVAKPLAAPGIGWPALPDDVRRSPWLTRNHLAQLSGALALPDETEVNEFKLLELSDLFLERGHDGAALERALHEQAATHLDRNDVAAAWKTLLAFNAG